MRDLGGILLVLGVLGMLLALLRGLKRRWRIHGELTRKGVHLGMGLVCSAFPWIFSGAGPVFLLAGLSLLGLWAVRVLPPLRTRFLPVLGGHERQSLGEYLFPVGIAVVFALSQGDPILYCIPVLILTIADALGALVGLRYGLSKYSTDEGEKSAEGSLAIFVSAFLIAHVPLLLLTQTGRAESVLTALSIGLLVTVIEAICWKGIDNLVLPLSVYFLLLFYPALGVSELLARTFVLLGLVAFTLLTRRRTTLTDSSLLAAALGGYLLWALGGWLWLVGGLILFATYACLPSFAPPDRPLQKLHAVTRVMTGGFFWLAASLVFGPAWLVCGFLACYAAHTGNIIEARTRVLGTFGSDFLRVLVATFAAFLLYAPLVWLAAAAAGLPWLPALGILAISTAASTGAFAVWWTPDSRPANAVRRLWAESAIAPTTSLLFVLLGLR